MRAVALLCNRTWADARRGLAETPNSESIERIFLLRLAQQHPTTGVSFASQVVVALGNKYGARDAETSCSIHARSALNAHGFEESVLEKAVHFAQIDGKVRAVLQTHIDGFLFAYDGSEIVSSKIASIDMALHMKRSDRLKALAGGLADPAGPRARHLPRRNGARAPECRTLVA